MASEGEIPLPTGRMGTAAAAQERVKAALDERWSVWRKGGEQGSDDALTAVARSGGSVVGGKAAVLREMAALEVEQNGSRYAAAVAGGGLADWAAAVRGGARADVLLLRALAAALRTPIRVLIAKGEGLAYSQVDPPVSAGDGSQRPPVTVATNDGYWFALDGPGLEPEEVGAERVRLHPRTVVAATERGQGGQADAEFEDAPRELPDSALWAEMGLADPQPLTGGVKDPIAPGVWLVGHADTAVAEAAYRLNVHGGDAATLVAVRRLPGATGGNITLPLVETGADDRPVGGTEAKRFVSGAKWRERVLGRQGKEAAAPARLTEEGMWVLVEGHAAQGAEERAAATAAAVKWFAAAGLRIPQDPKVIRQKTDTWGAIAVVDVDQEAARGAALKSGCIFGGTTLTVQEAWAEQRTPVVWLVEDAVASAQEVRALADALESVDGMGGNMAGTAVDTKLRRRGIRVVAAAEATARAWLGSKARPPPRPHWVIEGIPRGWRMADVTAALQRWGKWGGAKATWHVETTRSSKAFRVEAAAPPQGFSLPIGDTFAPIVKESAWRAGKKGAPATQKNGKALEGAWKGDVHAPKGGKRDGQAQKGGGGEHRSKKGSKGALSDGGKENKKNEKGGDRVQKGGKGDTGKGGKGEKGHKGDNGAHMSGVPKQSERIAVKAAAPEVETAKAAAEKAAASAAASAREAGLRAAAAAKEAIKEAIAQEAKAAMQTAAQAVEQRDTVTRKEVDDLHATCSRTSARR